MYSRRVRKVDAKEKSFVDATAKAMAKHVAATQSRRGLLFNVAAGTAALFGIRFVAPQVVDTLFSMPSAEARVRKCTHPYPGCGASDLNCGMGNAVDCFKYLNNSGPRKACAGCWDSGTGCPMGLTKGSAVWGVCCKCSNDPALPGTIVNYFDCCGTFAQMPPACTDDICQDKVENSGCSNTAGCQIAGPNPWCGTSPGLAICTFAEDTGTVCPKS